VLLLVASNNANKYSFRVYKLINPLDGSIFWVGKNWGILRYRLKCHITEAKNRPERGNKAKNIIIIKILEAGLTPEILEVEDLGDTHGISDVAYGLAEKYWIRWHIERGHPLVNIKDR
jgi:hypothetical protein